MAPDRMKASTNSKAKVSASRNGVLRSKLAPVSIMARSQSCRVWSWRMHAVAGVAHGVDQRDFEWPVDFGPQPADMGFDDACLGVEVKIPDPFQKHGAGDDAAFAAHQHF